MLQRHLKKDKEQYAISFCAIQDSYFDGGHTFIILSKQLAPEQNWFVVKAFGFNPKPGTYWTQGFWGVSVPGVVKDKAYLLKSKNIRHQSYLINKDKFNEVLLIAMTHITQGINERAFENYHYNCVRYTKNMLATAEINDIAPQSIFCNDSFLPRAYWYRLQAVQFFKNENAALTHNWIDKSFPLTHIMK